MRVHSKITPARLWCLPWGSTLSLRWLIIVPRNRVFSPSTHSATSGQVKLAKPAKPRRFRSAREPRAEQVESRDSDRALELAVSFRTRFTYPESDSALVGKGAFSLHRKACRATGRKTTLPLVPSERVLKAPIVVRHQHRRHTGNEVVQPVSGRTRHWKRRGGRNKKQDE